MLKDKKKLLLAGILALPATLALDLPENAKVTFPSWNCSIPTLSSTIVQAADLRAALKTASLERVINGVHYLHGPIPADKDLTAYFTYQPSIAPNNAIAVAVNVIHANGMRCAEGPHEVAKLPADARKVFAPWKCQTHGSPPITTVLSSEEIATAVSDAKLYAVHNYVEQYIGLIPKLSEAYAVSFSYIEGHNPSLVLRSVSGFSNTYCAPVTSKGNDSIHKQRGLSHTDPEQEEHEKERSLKFSANSKIHFPPYQCSEHRMFDEPMTGDQKMIFTTTDLSSAISKAKLIRVDGHVHHYRGSVYTALGISPEDGRHSDRALATVYFSYTPHTSSSEPKLEVETVESAWGDHCNPVPGGDIGRHLSNPTTRQIRRHEASGSVPLSAIKHFQAYTCTNNHKTNPYAIPSVTFQGSELEALVAKAHLIPSTSSAKVYTATKSISDYYDSHEPTWVDVTIEFEYMPKDNTLKLLSVSAKQFHECHPEA